MLIRRKSDNQFIIHYQNPASFQTTSTIRGALSAGGNIPLGRAIERHNELAAAGIETYLAEPLNGLPYDPTPEPAPVKIYTAVEAEPEPVPVVPEPVAVVEAEPPAPIRHLRPADVPYDPSRRPIRRVMEPQAPTFTMSRNDYLRMPSSEAQMRYNTDNPPGFRAFVDSLPAVK